MQTYKAWKLAQQLLSKWNSTGVTPTNQWGGHGRINTLEQDCCLCLCTGTYHRSIHKTDWMYTMGGHGPNRAFQWGAGLLCLRLMFCGQCGLCFRPGWAIEAPKGCRNIMSSQQGQILNRKSSSTTRARLPNLSLHTNWNVTLSTNSEHAHFSSSIFVNVFFLISFSL